MASRSIHRAPRGDVAAPFSVRLTADEKSRLLAKAGGVPLGLFMRDAALGEAAKGRAARKSVPLPNREEFGRALGLLGQSRLAGNLSALAEAAASGSLFVDAPTKAAIEAACADVQAIRALLMAALGMKCGDEGSREGAPSRAFARATGRVRP